MRGGPTTTTQLYMHAYMYRGCVAPLVQHFSSIKPHDWQRHWVDSSLVFLNCVFIHACMQCSSPNALRPCLHSFGSWSLLVLPPAGGWDSSKSGPEAFLGDVWTLDLTTWAWEQQQPAGEQLQGISRFQAVVDGSRILLHTHRCDNHILALHTDSSPPRIEKVSVKGPAPSSRGLHTVLKAGNALYLYGGAPQKGPMLDDLWRLDLTTMQWTQLQPKGQTPHARCSPAAAVVGRYLVYFGGAFYGASGGLEMLQDVQLYDIEANSWVVPEVAAADGSSNAELPAARNAAVMVPLSEQGSGGGPQLLLAGGWRAFVQTFNDTFLVQLSS